MQAFSKQTQVSGPARGAASSCFGSSAPRRHPRARAARQVAADALVGCKLAGVGSSVPSTVLSNADLERFVETSDEWITSRTGIKRRHVLAEGESMALHAAEACKKALEMAGVAAEDVDIVLMATSTPDDAFGSACQVGGPPAASHIGSRRAWASPGQRRGARIALGGRQRRVTDAAAAAAVAWQQRARAAAPCRPAAAAA